MNITAVVFYIFMIMGTLITVSSHSWISMWMGMEINLISFIPILYKSKNKLTSEGCMIYFLIQSMGSIIMLTAVLSNSLTNDSLLMGQLFMIMLIISMMIKLGAAPCHSWLPEILKKSGWKECAIILTWQSIAPMSILSLSNNCMFTPIIIMSVMVGTIGGMNQTSLTKILGYSSINHMGWMMSCMAHSKDLWIIYLIVYSIIAIMMMMMFNKHSAYFINQIINTASPLPEKLNLIFLFMSMGGLPPFLGFYIKWMTIMIMMEHSPLLSIIMVMFSLITLFYYLRMINTSLLLGSSSMLTYQKKQNGAPFMMLFINMIMPMVMIMGS